MLVSELLGMMALVGQWGGRGVELTCGRAELYACIDVLHGCLAQPMAFVSLTLSVWFLDRA